MAKNTSNDVFWAIVARRDMAGCISTCDDVASCVGTHRDMAVLALIVCHCLSQIKCS